MGIKGLLGWVRKNAPSAMQTVPVGSLSGKVIAIDGSLSIYQFLISVMQMGEQLVGSDGNPTSHLHGLLLWAVQLVSSGIKPIYVFDAEHPNMNGMDKAGEGQKKMIESGNPMDIDRYSKIGGPIGNQLVKDCQKLLDLLGIPYVVAPCEAEAECAAICREGKAYAVATEDMDALTFAAPIMLRNLSYIHGKSDEIILINYQTMINEAELTMEEFVDFCILCGCDYCDNIRNIGPDLVFRLIKEFHSIEEIIKHIDKEKYPVPNGFDFVHARRLFFEYPVNTSMEFEWKMPKLKEIIQFMIYEKGFSESAIQRVLKILEKT